MRTLLAAEQAGELAADREAEAGAAVLAAGGAVGLLERLEDDLLLVRGMPMPVSVTEKASTGSAPPRVSLSGLQPSVAGCDIEADAAALGELEGVGEQVLEHLLQAPRVGVDHLGRRSGRAST
jgi:hypothetical protein